MEMLEIKGGNLLRGSIRIGGAKNSAVALVPAAILSDKVIIKNIPDISDVKVLEEILSYLNVSYSVVGRNLYVDSSNLKNKPITMEQSKKLRASYYFTGALLGKFKKAEMYFPGGCKIGKRPIDLHIYGFEKLGAKIIYKDNKYIITADELVGTDIDLSFPSVGATINILFAATMAIGKTVIKNSALEPEVDNVIDFLNSMGACIKRVGTSIEINGVSHLFGGKINIIPDRIEAGTYIIAGVMMGDNLKITDLNPLHIKSLLDILQKMGADIKVFKDYVIANKSNNLKPIAVETAVYPGFPTDLQQPLTSLLTLCNGESKVIENIYENRFQNVPYLNCMGANIKIDGKMIIIKGPTKFISGDVITTDLRAGAALIIAAICADGYTRIKEVKYILRGYENIIRKLRKIGVKIEQKNI